MYCFTVIHNVIFFMVVVNSLANLCNVTMQTTFSKD